MKFIKSKRSFLTICIVLLNCAGHFVNPLSTRYGPLHQTLSPRRERCKDNFIPSSFLGHINIHICNDYKGRWSGTQFDRGRPGSHLRSRLESQYRFSSPGTIVEDRTNEGRHNLSPAHEWNHRRKDISQASHLGID